MEKLTQFKPDWENYFVNEKGEIINKCPGYLVFIEGLVNGEKVSLCSMHLEYFNTHHRESRYDREIEIESMLYPSNLLKFFNQWRDDINKELFYEYIDKFEEISAWLHTIFIPKHREHFNVVDFYEQVLLHIKTMCYLFCNSFDGISAYYEGPSLDEKHIIFEYTKNEA